MKKYIFIVSTLIAMIISIMGCKSIPTIESMTATSNAIGCAAGMVANTVKLDDVSREMVVTIVNKVSTCIPETNETFQSAWGAIASIHISKMISDGKLTEEKGLLIEKAFNVACIGIDYLFDVRYPTARKYNDLIAAAVSGFNSGFLSMFKSTSTNFASTQSKYDTDAYDFITSKMK